MNDAKSKMNSLNSQISDLDAAMAAASNLADTCQRYVDQAKNEIDRSKRLEERLRGLDEAANQMTMRLRGLQNRTLIMKDIAEDRHMLEDGMREFVQDVMNGGQNDLMKICQPLVKLLEPAATAKAGHASTRNT